MIFKLGRASAEGGVTFRSTVELVDTESGDVGCSVVDTPSAASRAGIGAGASH